MPSALEFDRLDSTEFEEFVVDLLVDLKFVNVDWRKGTGKRASPADRGRDIVCQEVREDIDGAVHLETWFVDCKHFRRGVPPTELQNVLAWAEAESPHVMLIAASHFLSNGAKDYLESYRRTRRPPFKIKVWEKPKLEALARRRLRLVRKYNLSDEPIRSVAAIARAEQEFFSRVWYDRHQMIRPRLSKGRTKAAKQVWQSARVGAREIERKLGKKSLGPYSDFDWGMACGKLSALRWVLGMEWDMLDT